MKKILLTIMLLVNLLINAQTTFSEQNIIDYTEADEPKSIYMVDVDGDGDMDVISASRNDNKIAWYENTDDNGTFGTQQIITTNAEGARSVFASDIDGDGDMDVISASIWEVAWYENTDGNGTFGTPQIITTNVVDAQSVFAGDIDGDGDMDVISASRNDNKIAWYENTDGSGAFGTQQIITTNVDGANSVFASDIDGDGDMDVLSASKNDDKIAWYENTDGNGAFGTQQIITTSTEGANSVFATDIDGDGDMDVLSASYSDNKIAWYENTDGNGTFGTQQIITTNANYVLSVFAGDIDGDGDMDVLSASFNDDKIAWYENTDGNGTFGTQQIITTSADGANSVFAGDIDGDGDMDVLSASDDITWYKNTDGNGTFSTPQTITISIHPISVFATDIDGDGDMDVLFTSSDHQIAWYENIDGNGAFSVQHITSATNANSVFATDIDGDGDMDVLSASGYTKITWYENVDGSGAFGAQQIITINADNVLSVFAADIDGDGDMDVLSASAKIGDNKIAWYENTDGNGTFGAQQIITTNANWATSVFATDIDGDGDMDVLSASEGDDKIAWYENTDGNGTFGAQQIITTNAEGARSVFASDIDGDGDIDVLSASWDGGSWEDSKIAWYENTDGNGTFGVQQIISTALYANTVFASDIDNDGDIDVLSAYSEDDDKIAWYENTDGNGTFGTVQIITTDATAPVISDFDGDGDMDVLSILGRNSLAWYENLGLTTNRITGTVTINLAGNCSTLASNIMVKTSNEVYSFSTFSLTNGIYQLFPEVGDFTTEIVASSIPNYYTSNPNLYNDNFIDVGNSVTHNFCIEPSQTANDVTISLLPTSQARPGFNTTYQIVYKNVGTTQLNGNVTLEFDNTKLNFLNASETLNTQTSNTLTFNYSNLTPFETRIIDLEFHVHTPTATQSVNIGDILNFTTSINPITGDYTVDDNTFTLNQTVVGSYDPNDIICLEGDEILLANSDKYLHYVIRFQNTGNFHATFIRIHNTLDDKLDWNTIQMESANHDYKVEIVNGNEVDFKFESIYLPGSTTDEPNSHGFIAYKIKPKAGIALGDIIPNKVDIFFDYNAPVETNTATTTIVNVLSVDKNTLLNFSVYPTPTENILNIKSKTEIAKIEIYSKLGQLILKNTTENQIDISNLTQGLYFVKVTAINGDFGVKKVVKK